MKFRVERPFVFRGHTLTPEDGIVELNIYIKQIKDAVLAGWLKPVTGRKVKPNVKDIQKKNDVGEDGERAGSGEDRAEGKGAGDVKPPRANDAGDS